MSQWHVGILMSNTAYFIDANIIMYAVGASHPLKDPCAQILIDIGNQLIQVVTNIEVLQEILHRYTSLKRRVEATRVARDLIRLASKIYPITLAEIERALQIHLQYPALTARDSIHTATMYNQGPNAYFICRCPF
ncbi:type II toxin-antitoxin system VapC family toxin [soil metagenome]